MTKELTTKVIRIIVGAMAFMCLTSIAGLEQREAHQYIMMLSLMAVFGLLLKNIWATLFLWLTIILFSYYKFQLGYLYLANVFYGCVLYYICKISFKKEQIDEYINIVLWVIAINLIYGVVQMIGYDFYFETNEKLFMFKGLEQIEAPKGFMANSGVMASMIAMAIPLLATRSKVSLYLSFLLFIPLVLLHSSMNIIAAVVGILFVLYFKIPKKVFITICVLGGLLVSGIFIAKVDTVGVERITMWKQAMFDAKMKPVSGWGLDSFRHKTEQKPFTYYKLINKTVNNQSGKQFGWDNPHNLFISVFYEWGIFGLILLGGYLTYLRGLFTKSIKSPNVVGLAGFIVVFLVISMGHFPIFLARCAVIIVPCLALFEVECG